MENWLKNAFDTFQRDLEFFHASDLVFGKPVAKFKGYSLTYNVYLSYSANNVCMLSFGRSFSHSRMFCGSTIDAAMCAARIYYDAEKCFN